MTPPARPTPAIPGVLLRHDLRHADGRALHVYGELRGALDGEAAAPSAPLGAGTDEVHLRREPLTGEWITVSPARNRRPLTHQPGAVNAGAQAAVRDASGVAAPQEAPRCPLCPGGPEVPFSYDAAVFDNRFPSLMPDPPAPPQPETGNPLERYDRAEGRCEVVLYTEQHVGSLATLEPEQVLRVVAVWVDRSRALWADARLAYVLVFENRGEGVGATLSHPHGQIYAFATLPPIIATRDARCRGHRAEAGRCLGCDVVALDDASPGRQVLATGGFSVAVPFAPRWPYEVHVRARRHGAGRLGDLTAQEQRDLAQALQLVVRRFDGLFGFALPYMMVAHESPRGQADWHLSFEFFPPHRGPDKLKVRASVETASGWFINDTLPEDSAAALAAVGVPDEDWLDLVAPTIVPAGA